MALAGVRTIFAVLVVTMEAAGLTHVVWTTSGRVRGDTVVEGGRALRWYRGVPYAEPPVGDLRFRAPVAVRAWPGVRDAREFGPSCPQDIDAVPVFYPEYVVRIPETARKISEDCLTLNVYSPVVEGGGGGVQNFVCGSPSFFRLS